jgi:hypothetical protein
MTDAAAKRKPWAVLAYTVADDKGGGASLDAAAKNELKALCDAADFGRVSIAAQVDFTRTKGVYRGSITAAPPKSRDFEDIRPEDHPLWRKILGNVDATRSSVRLQAEADDLNAARSDVLQEFLRFGRQECPAERYVVFFYGHAYGPMGLFCDAASGERDPDTLRLNDLAGSLETTGGRAAILVFRDCFMNTLETAYQLRDSAEFMIATQALAPVSGVWPWLNFMATLAPSAATIDAATALAVQLAHFLNEPKNRAPFATVPYSLVDLSASAALVDPLKTLVDALSAAREDPKRSRACARALEAARVGYPDDYENPGDPALIDAPTMCDALEAITGDPVSAAARALGDVVRDRLVRWRHDQKGVYRGTSLYYKPLKRADITRSHLQAADAGIAAADAAYYEALDLSRATGWNRIALNPLAL